MEPKIIITGVHTEESIQKFKSLPGCRIVFCEQLDEISPEDLADGEMLVGGVNPEIVKKMPRLRFVQLFSAGANGFSWLPETITLANAYGAYGDSIAEHMLTTTLMAMKRMPEYLEMQGRQGWELLRDIERFEGSKVLSVGMGAIGGSYLRKAAALGAVCYGVRRTVHDKPDFVEVLTTPEGMDELLPEMDVVALSLPGTDEVRGMFDERRLRLMKKSAIIVNVGRGNSIVTEDLIRVMEEGHLRAACLDVMAPEPLPKGHPLWTTPRVYITPHISGGYRAGVNYSRVIDTAVLNLSRVLKGEGPIHAVDRALGY
ncbi:MAG: D-2-hydroxyacid dehydrogenase [Lachnospiraceae bacterium]|nr:D-2-hydroxyacid dehydrogenase [Lachnospiraceae bacterium]